MKTQTEAQAAAVRQDAEIEAARPKTGGSFVWDEAAGGFAPHPDDVKRAERSAAEKAARSAAAAAEVRDPADVPSDVSVSSSKGAK